VSDYRTRAVARGLPRSERGAPKVGHSPKVFLKTQDGRAKPRLTSGAKPERKLIYYFHLMPSTDQSIRERAPIPRFGIPNRNPAAATECRRYNFYRN
jgi:hypothetical protein